MLDLYNLRLRLTSEKARTMECEEEICNVFVLKYIDVYNILNVYFIYIFSRLYIRIVSYVFLVEDTPIEEK